MVVFPSTSNQLLPQPVSHDLNGRSAQRTKSPLGSSEILVHRTNNGWNIYLCGLSGGSSFRRTTMMSCLFILPHDIRTLYISTRQYHFWNVFRTCNLFPLLDEFFRLPTRVRNSKKLSGQQNFPRKNFPDKARKSHHRRFRDKWA